MHSFFRENLLKINFVSALAGAGKTHQSILSDAVRTARTGERILIVMPTKRLIAETANELAKIAPDVPFIQIVGNDNPDERSVVSRLVRKMREPFRGGELVACTHAALIRLPQFRRKFADWSLIIDEVPQVHGFSDLMIDNDVLALTDQCDRQVSPFPGYMAMSLSKSSKSLFDANAGSQRASVFDLAWKLRSRHTWVHVPESSMEALRSEQCYEKKFQAFTLVTPQLVEPFQSVQILSANFEKTLLFHLWSKNGASFVEDKEVGKRLRFHEHDGSQTTIHYVIDRHWSRKLQDIAISGETLHSKIAAKAAEFFGDQKFLWVANKDHGSELFADCSNAHQLPNVSHGLNGFQDFDNIIHMSALNPSTPEFRYFQSMGVSAEQAKSAFFYESVYQSVMRCSLRSQAVARPVTVVVMDKATADYLNKLLPGSTVKRLDWIAEIDVAAKKPGQPKKHKNSTERKRASRHRAKMANLHDQFVSDCHYLMVPDINHIGGRHDIPIIYNTDNVTNSFWGTQFKSKTAAIENDMFLSENLGNFICCLKNMACMQISNKEDRALISPAYFDPKKSKRTYRGNENVEFNRGIWLDHDGGVISPEAFAKMFPNLQMVMFNSFSSTKEKLRYRVFIPTTTVFSPQTHETIMNAIWNRLHKAGYKGDYEAKANKDSRWHGFDHLGKSPSSLFYLPCQAAEPSGNIWLDFTGEVGRKVLDPREWIRKFHVEPEASEQPDAITAEPLSEDVNRALVASARMWWRNLPHTPGTGGKNFFKLGLRLSSAGLPDVLLEQELRHEAIFALHPIERKEQIPSIIGSLKIYKPGMSSQRKAA